MPEDVKASPSQARSRTTTSGASFVLALAGVVVVAALLSFVLGGCKLRFGTAGKDPFIPAPGDQGRPCTADGDCIQGLRCCAGWCAGCCADGQCPDLDPCKPASCVDGACDSEAPILPPRFQAALEGLDAPSSVLSRETLAFLVLSRSVAVVDMVDAQRPRIAGSMSFPGTILDAQMAGNLLAVMVRPDEGGDPEIHVVDVSLPSRPRLAVVATLDRLETMALTDGILTAVSPSTFWVVDLSSPAEPVTRAKISIPCQAPVSMASWDARVAVACGQEGLVLLDVTDPVNPTVTARGLLDSAILVRGGQGLWAVTEEEGASPCIVQPREDGPPLVTRPLEGSPPSALVDFDGRLLMASRQGQGLLLDVQEGTEATLVTALTTGHLWGGRALVLSQGTLSLLGVGAQLALTTLSSMDLSLFSTISDVDIQAGHGVLAFREGGLVIFDATVPDAPRITHSLSSPRPIRAATWSGPREVALVDDEGAVILLDFSDPSSAPRTHTWDPPGGAKALDVYAQGGPLLVTQEDGTLSLLIHAGMEEPQVMDVRQLDSPSLILGTAQGPLMALGTGPERTLVVLDVRWQQLELGPPSEPIRVADGPVAAAPGWLVEAPEHTGGALRVSTRGGEDPSPDASWVEGLDSRALAWNQSTLWSLGPGGLAAMAPGDAGLRLIHLSGAPVPCPGALPLTTLIPFQGGLAAVGPRAVLFAATTLPPLEVAHRPVVRSELRGAAWSRDGDLVLATGPGGLVAWSRLDGTPVVGVQRSPCAADAAPVQWGDREHLVTAGCHGGLVVDSGEPFEPHLVCDVLHGEESPLLARCHEDLQGAAWYAVNPEGRMVKRLTDAGPARLTARSGSVVAELVDDGGLRFLDAGISGVSSGSLPSGLVVDHVTPTDRPGRFAVAAGSTVLSVDASDAAAPGVIAKLDTGLSAPLVLARRGTTVIALDPTGRAATIQVGKKGTLTLGKEQASGFSGATVALGTAGPQGPVLFARDDGQGVLLWPGLDPVGMSLLAAPRQVLVADGRTVLGGRASIWVEDAGATLDDPAGLGTPAPVVQMHPTEGGLAVLLADGRAGLVRLGAQGPVEQLSLIETAEAVESADVAGEALCLAAGPAGLLVADLREPQPVPVVPVLQDRDVRDVAAVDLTCWALLSDGDLVSVSVVDPSSPRVAETPPETDAEDTVETGDEYLPSRLWAFPPLLITGSGPVLQLWRMDDQGELTEAYDIEMPRDVVDLVVQQDILVAWGSQLWFASLGDPVKLLATLDGAVGAGAVQLDQQELVVAQHGSLIILDGACLGSWP